MKRQLCVLTGLLSVALLPNTSSGAVIHTTRASFDLAAGPTTTETFEATGIGTLTTPFTFPTGLVTQLSAGSVRVHVQNEGFSGFGFVDTTPGAGTTRVLAFGDSVDTGAYTVRYDLPFDATAFGFDLSGYQGQGSQFSVSLLQNGSTIDSFNVPDTTLFSAHFRGFTSAAPFDEVRITFSPFGGGAADFVAFDQVSFNQAAVPEPSTFALFGVVLALGAGCFFYHRQRNLASIV